MAGKNTAQKKHRPAMTCLGKATATSQLKIGDWLFFNQLRMAVAYDKKQLSSRSLRADLS